MQKSSPATMHQADLPSGLVFSIKSFESTLQH